MQRGGKNIRRDSVFSVPLGGKTFPPKFVEITESRPKKVAE
jgi:hypothetical protein